VAATLIAVGLIAAGALALASSAIAATKTRAHHGALSPRLAAVAKHSFGKASPRRQGDELSLPAQGPGSLLRQGKRYVVDVRVAHRTGATARRLARLHGVSVVSKASRYMSVTVAVPASALRRLSREPGVAAVNEELTPMASAVCQGSVTSEGLQQLHADQVQNAGITGTGVKVGILSDSFDTDAAAATHAANDVSSGDLPGPGNPCARTTAVHNIQDFAGGADEGRGMLQIVHDLAPDASLAFATAEGGQNAFANNIRALATDGSKVIADDITYFAEPFFQDGPVAVAVNDVTAGGATYFSSAANNNLIVGGNNVASWEAPAFRDGGPCPTGVPSYATHCMDFNPGASVDNDFAFTVPNGRTLKIDTQWAQPWFGVTTDLDLYLLNSANTVVANSESVNVGGGSPTQQPFEFLSFTNSTGSAQTYRLAIDRCNASCAGFPGPDDGTPRVKFALLENGSQAITSSEYPVSAGGDIVGPTIFGHNGAGNAMSTAAVPFSNSSTPETYSSRGPLTQYFGPVSGTTPAAPIAPTTLLKPDIAATDCGMTSFFVPTGTPGLFRFCGTSAAAPHAAAVAALELQANPGASVQQVKDAQISNAVPVGAFTHNDVGAGLVDAFAAVNSLDVAPTVTVTGGPSGRTNDSTPTFTFSADKSVTFTCSIDGGPAQTCTSPFTPGALGDGNHTLTVTASDGFKSATSSSSFTVDTTGPKSKITKHPKKRTSQRKAKFKFKALAPDATRSNCKLDKKKFKPCRSPKKVKVKPGKHAFTVQAFDDLGNKGKATKFKWKVTN
jgi:hypothetical protein